LLVTLNGEPRELSDGSTIQDVVQSLGLQEQQVAVEHNRSILKREKWNETAVAEGDQLEIVHFVGGG
jgi:thiamine biosynthesis protein ThiS